MQKIFSKDLLMKLEGVEPTPQIPSAWLYKNRINEAGANVRTLYHYNNSIGGEVVTVPYGHTELQDYQDVGNNSYSTLPFYNHQNITNVDLKSVPFRNGSMNRAFAYCNDLSRVDNINENVSAMGMTFYNCQKLNYTIQLPYNLYYMSGTFRGCINLNRDIRIPSRVNSMSEAFMDCYNFNTNIRIPSGVTNMYRTFKNCNALNQNIWLPSSVTNVRGLFHGCEKLNQNIQLPSGITDMTETFSDCINLNQNIKIPTSVKYLTQTFFGCRNLNQSIQIYNNTISMSSTFAYCYNLNSKITIPNSVSTMTWTFRSCLDFSNDVIIHSANVTNTMECFNGTSLTKYVTIPYRYINNTFTQTRNSFNSAGYLTGTNGISSTTINGVTIRDFIASPWWFGYSTYTGNGTHWILQKWNGASDYQQTIDVSQTYKNVTIPNKLTTYDTFPTGITNATFTANAIIENIDCNNVPLDTTIPHYAFRNCFNLKSIKNLNIPDTQANMQAVFENCRSMLNNPIDNTPSACTQAAYLYKGCTNLGLESPQVIRFGQNVINYRQTFNGCSNLWGDIYFYNWGITTGSNRWNGTFTGYNTQRRRNLWCYFTYQNGVNTPTYNILKGATYNNNATSNFYIYNIGVCPV